MKLRRPCQQCIQVYAHQEDNTYNEVGDLKQDFEQYLEYNSFNQLFRVRENNSTGLVLEEYTYDPNGERVMKFEPLLNQITYYVSDEYVQVVNSSGTFVYTYYHDPQTGELLGRKDSDGRKYYYHPDHLGSTDLVTNQTGGVAEESTYEPYGEIVAGGDSRFLFTSKELDKQSRGVVEVVLR